MTTSPLAPSSGLTEQDRKNRALALDLIRKSNATVTSFAKQMVTTSLSAVGVILALAKFHGFENHASAWLRIALGVACVLCLTAALVFAFALRPRRIRVSLDDYADAPAQLLAIAHHRELFTIWGLALLAAGIAGTILLLTLA